MEQPNFSVPEGRNSSTSDIDHGLMRRRQEEETQLSALQAAIDTGRASGEDPRMLAEIFEGIRRDHLAKHS